MRALSYFLERGERAAMAAHAATQRTLVKRCVPVMFFVYAALLDFCSEAHMAAVASFRMYYVTTGVRCYDISPGIGINVRVQLLHACREAPTGGSTTAGAAGEEAPLSPDEAAAAARHCRAAALEDLLLWLCGYEVQP